jgi:nitrogen-specific signal transduction histidine kinase/CheY-like chemotaxis protein
LSVVASPLRDAGGAAVGVAATFRDISAQKNLEAQLAFSDRMVSIGTLAAGVAHEINNPLASLVGNLELARERLAGLPGDVREELAVGLADAQEAAERVTRIVRDLKSFSRAEDERLGSVDLHQAVDSALRIASNEIRHRARLVEDFGGSFHVHANEARLGQVLVNLLMNAVQAIPEGHHDANEIRVATRADSTGGVTLSVSDTGCGMPPEVQRRLFTAFFTTKPIGVGTGLGLAISQRIVVAFGGRITFESAVGKGSRFVVTLRSAQPADKTAASNHPPAVEIRRRGKVLVIDDEPGILRMVTRILASEHDVTATSDATEGLRLICGGGAYDVILCDLMMPQLSGVDLYEQVRRERPGHEARMVFMTGGAFTDKTRDFLDVIANRKLSKPFSAREVRALLSELVP